MADQDPRSGEIPQRPLGRTGAKVSALGVGGHHLGDFKILVEEAIRLVRRSLSMPASLLFSTTAGSTGTVAAEDWLGRNLKGERDKVVLMTKVCNARASRRSGDEDAGGIKLRRLQTVTTSMSGRSTASASITIPNWRMPRGRSRSC